jgi:hypothetical protein
MDGFLAMTVTGGVNDHRIHWGMQECFGSFQAFTRAIDEVETAQHPDKLATMSSDEERLAAMFSDAMKTALGNRCLVFPSTGHVCLGPQTMEVDHVVAIFSGCNTPVILRPLGNDCNEYAFVGDCYIHGIMDGEAVEAHHERNGEDVIFFLR